MPSMCLENSTLYCILRQFIVYLVMCLIFCRNHDYYGEEHHTTTSDGNIAHLTGVDASTYEHSSIPQADGLKSEPHETAQENQYSFPSSSHEFTYENAQQPDATYPHSQTSAQIQNLSPFSSVMVMHNFLRFCVQYAIFFKAGSCIGSLII